MRGLVALLAVAAAFAGGGYYVYSHPGAPAQATQAIRSGAAWVQGHVPTPPTATPVTMPGATLPPPTATAEPTATPAPVVLVIPTDSPAPAPPTASPDALAPMVALSPADCTWAVTVLTNDAQLDGAEAQAVADGSDTRYGNTPARVAYYQDSSDQLTAFASELSAGPCATPPTTLDDATRSTALAWFAQAASEHAVDAAAFPANAEWDQYWETVYASLTTLYSGQPG